MGALTDGGAVATLRERYLAESKVLPGEGSALSQIFRLMKVIPCPKCGRRLASCKHIYAKLQRIMDMTELEIAMLEATRE